MKIVFIITDFGSFNNFLSELSVRLSLDNEIHVITSQKKVINITDKFDYKAFNIKFHFVDFPRSFNFIQQYQASSKIQDILRKIKPDLVSLHFTTGIFTSLLKGKIPFKNFGFFHGLGFPVIDNPVKKAIFRAVEYFSASRLDEIWVLNKMDYEILRKNFKKVNLLPTNGLGCDLDKFNPEKFSKEFKNNLRKELKIGKEDRVIVFTGRYVQFKGYDIVIKTFRELEKSLPNLKLITMGGPDKIHSNGLSAEETEYLEKNPNIMNIGFTPDVEKYLSIADLFFFPSKKEGVPICIVEALAMGIPVLTFNSRGCNDLVTSGKNGLLADVDAKIDDFKSLAIKLLDGDDNFVRDLKENIHTERPLLSRNNFIDHQINYFKSK